MGDDDVRNLPRVSLSASFLDDVERVLATRYGVSGVDSAELKTFLVRGDGLMLGIEIEGEGLKEFKAVQGERGWSVFPVM